MNIGEKIKRIRQHRRMTQKELGELVDLSANRIAQYEMGYRVPKKPLLNQIAEALRVSPVAMWFDDTILDDFLKDWAAVQKKLYAGEITQAEYFEWKIMWPET